MNLLPPQIGFFRLFAQKFHIFWLYPYLLLSIAFLSAEYDWDH